MKNILDIENLSIGFKKTIFENIKAEVNLGSMTALIGVNGAGKSCLLKTIGRLIDSHKGVIKLNGKNINDYSNLEFAQTVSLVLTEKFHVDYLKVDELISLGRSPYTGWSGDLRETDSEFVLKVINQIGLFQLKDKFFSELSDGQKQKVLIARALAQNPKLLILDEPTTYLDIPSKIDLIKLLKKIAIENNVAVIMSTHDLELVEKYVDQIWLMGADGSFSVGSPAELSSSGLLKKHLYFNEN